MIKLTHENGKALYINLEKIESFIRGYEYTEVYFSGESWWNVKETPEEIVEIINEQHRSNHNSV